MEGKKLFSKGDILLFPALLALAGLLFLLLSLMPRGTRVIVERDGDVVAARELSRLTGQEELSVEGENGIGLTITFYPDGAAVTSASCRDQVCVHTGKITRAGETALCLPAKVSLRVEGASAVDADTY